MKISKTHKRFSKRLNNPETLTDPEKYLGPNYQDVLNFWIYVDSLSDQEKKKIYDSYCALDYIVWGSAMNTAWNVADEVVGWEFRKAAWYAAWDVTGCFVFGYATLELIGLHELLEQGKTLLALQYCTKP